MKHLAFVALLLLFGGNSCLALEVEAKFSKEHACVAVSEHIASCEVRWGDSLSKDALAVYGDWHRYSAIKDVNPEIVDENKIYAGARINIPDMPTTDQNIVAAPATPRVQSHAVAVAAAQLMDLQQVRSTIATEPTPEFSVQLPMESIASFPLTEHLFPAVVEIASARPSEPSSTLPQTNTERARVKQASVVHARLPGRHRKMKNVLLTIGKISMSGAIMTFTVGGGNPIIGFGTATGAWAIPALITRHNNAVDRKNADALEKANEALATATAAVEKSQGGSL